MDLLTEEEKLNLLVDLVINKEDIDENNSPPWDEPEIEEDLTE